MIIAIQKCNVHINDAAVVPLFTVDRFLCSTILVATVHAVTVVHVAQATYCPCCVFSNGRVKSAASSDVPKRNDREIQEVLPMVEDLSVQAQLHGSASTSGEGGKQGEKTFPSVQAQLDELRPLVNARLQEGTTW